MTTVEKLIEAVKTESTRLSQELHGEEVAIKELEIELNRRHAKALALADDLKKLLAAATRPVAQPKGIPAPKPAAPVVSGAANASGEAKKQQREASKSLRALVEAKPSHYTKDSLMVEVCKQFPAVDCKVIRDRLNQYLSPSFGMLDEKENGKLIPCTKP